MKEFPRAVQIHDLFNITVLGFISMLIYIYLWNYTDIKLIGTPEIASTEDSRQLFSVFYFLFVIYIIIDTIWIILVPNSVMVASYQVVIHHIVTFSVISIPWFAIQFQWITAVGLSVELQTVVLACRRRFPKSSLMYKIFDISFYILWVIFRLIVFPTFTVFLWFEYQRYTAITNTWFNVMILAPSCVFFITMQGFVWTYSLFSKTLTMDKKLKEK